jgi:hypothetical protein
MSIAAVSDRALGEASGWLREVFRGEGAGTVRGMA